MNIRRSIQNALLAGEPKPSLWMEFARLGVRVQGSHRPPDDSIVLGLERGAVLSAIGSLPDHMSAWLRFTYGASNRSDRDIVARYAIEGGDRSDRLQVLAILATEDAAIRASSDGSRKYPVAVYTEAMQISEQAFQARWKARRNLILDKLNTLDDQGVGSVWRKLHKKGEKRV